MTEEATRTGMAPGAEEGGMSERKRPGHKNPEWNQMDVLDAKDNVTRQDSGLQEWGEQGEDRFEEGIHGGPLHNYGDSMGTAERQRSIGGLAEWAKKGKKGPLEEEE